MRSHDARLAPAAALSLIGCALIGGGVNARWVASVLVLLALVTTLLIAFNASLCSRGTGMVRDICVAVAMSASIAALICGSAALRQHTSLDPDTRAGMVASESIEVHGTVLNEPRPTSPDPFTGEERWRATIGVDRVDGAPAHAAMDIVLDHIADVTLGDRVRVTGAWSHTPDPRRAAVIWDARMEVVGEGDWRARAVDGSRERLRAAAATLPESVEGLTVGMVIGDDSRMPPSQVTDMRRSGLAHLTAVSGAHFAILAVAVQWVVRRWRWPRLVQASVLGIVMVAFAALTGAEPSVVRALVMGLIIAVALAWGRPARALAALSASVIALLAVDPPLASALGFQLSVAAVAGIVLWSPHLALRFSMTFTPTFARVLAIPTAAMGATLPLIVGIAGGVGLYSVPANVVAGAAAGPVTVLGLLAVMVAWIWPQAARVLVETAGVAARPVEWAARAFSDAPGAWLSWPTAPWGAPLAAVIVACVIAATTARRVRGWWRIGLLVAVVGLAASAPPFTALRAPSLPHWEVVACDVGQGDMMLLRSGHASAVVIDTGPPGGSGVQCLRRFGVRTVDLLILTHPHADHDGAVAEVLATVPVAQAWVTPAALDEGTHMALERAGVPVTAAFAPSVHTVGNVRIQVLHPPQSWNRATSDSTENDASITVLAQASGTTVLALGDLETAGQEALQQAFAGPWVVDIVKVAHHGSATQSETLAAQLTARLGVISVGANNSYGHPAPVTEELYGERVQVLLRTDLCGDIAVATDNGITIASRCPIAMAG